MTMGEQRAISREGKERENGMVSRLQSGRVGPRSVVKQDHCGTLELLYCSMTKDNRGCDL